MDAATLGNLRDELIEWIPNLRAFALSLTQSAQRSDDLVQDTIVRALSNLDKFQEGTNFRAWLFTILRNIFYNNIRYMKHHQTAQLDEARPSNIWQQAPQEKYIEFKDVLNGLARLVPAQREIIILIVAEGLSYEEAAAICNCPVGTVKSRLCRARLQLKEILDGGVPASPAAGTRRSLFPARTPRSRLTTAAHGRTHTILAKQQ